MLDRPQHFLQLRPEIVVAVGQEEQAVDAAAGEIGDIFLDRIEFLVGLQGQHAEAVMIGPILDITQDAKLGGMLPIVGDDAHNAALFPRQLLRGSIGDVARLVA